MMHPVYFKIVDISWLLKEKYGVKWDKSSLHDYVIDIRFHLYGQPLTFFL